ncbi:hypothetical protein Tco_1567349 [Tanacetum coccineum]
MQPGMIGSGKTRSTSSGDLHEQQRRSLSEKVKKGSVGKEARVLKNHSPATFLKAPERGSKDHCLGKPTECKSIGINPET